MKEEVAEVYHASKTPLDPGTALKSQFIKPAFKYQFESVRSALDEPPQMRASILKAMLLSDIVHNKGQSTLSFAVKETILEHIRGKEFPERLSRYQSVFVSPTRQDAAAFRELVRTSDDRPHLHTCETTESVFTADLQYVSAPNPFAPMLKQLEYVIARARHYWNGERSESPILEYLAEPGVVKIVVSADWAVSTGVTAST